MGVPIVFYIVIQSLFPVAQVYMYLVYDTANCCNLTGPMEVF